MQSLATSMLWQGAELSQLNPCCPGKPGSPSLPCCCPSCGEQGGQWPRQLQHLPICAAWPPEALAVTATSQLWVLQSRRQEKLFLPNWAMLAAEQLHLLWGKGCGLDGSLQQAGFDVTGHPRLDLFRLYLLCLAQTLEWIQDPLCPHGLFSGPQRYHVWLLKQKKVKMRLCRLL